MTEMSKQMEEYFNSIESEVKQCYEIAEKARVQNIDSVNKVSIVLARNLSERVEGLISVLAPQIKGSGVRERIKELEEKYGSQDWRVALTVALEVAQEKFCKFKNKKEAMEMGIRVGFSYVTVGVVSSPIEGFIGLDIRKRKDGKEYLAARYAGPIRSAGGTAASVSVLIVDYVRKQMGYDIYDPTTEEIKRTVAEVHFFHERATNLQYLPSERELEFLTANLPLQIDGDPSEKIETPLYKDLERIPTNFMRNGFCLVMAECLSLKAPKVWKKLSEWKDEFGLEHWNFLEKFVKIQKEVKARGKGKTEKLTIEKVSPDYTFIKDMVAGRPVFGYPLGHGTFRLRYGRARTSGFSSDAVHPATLVVLDNFIGIGTQLKTERPGKSTTITTCDILEGPIVKLKNGNVLRLETIDDAKSVCKDIDEIIYLGDILINYGDMFNRAHVLLPPGYCEEFWALDFEKVLGEDEQELYKEILENPMKVKVNFEESYKICKTYNMFLHPRYTYHWNAIKYKELIGLLEWLRHAVIKPNKVIFPIIYDFNKEIDGVDPKRVLELLGVPHQVANNEYVVVDGDWADSLAVSLGFYSLKFDFDSSLKKINPDNITLDNVNLLSEVKLRDKSGYFIGTRMGRPEKAKMRKMTGSPHVLFPVGDEGGRMRDFICCLGKEKINAEFQIYKCKKCDKKVIYRECPYCFEKGVELFRCPTCGIIEKNCGHERVTQYEKIELPIKDYFNTALKKLGMKEYPELIKGVRGTSNKNHFTERLEKGILRAIHNIYVNKDGTTRYDMTELAITHFKPKEVGTSVEKLIELGYTKDIYGNELVNYEQILELKCQDLILPACPDSLEEGADVVMYKVSKFVDDCLEKLYGLNRYYNFKDKKDLVGHLVIALSPHTAAGAVCRIVGFSKTQGMFASPLLHSLLRRDCDGDEAGIFLLMDGLLNFSNELLANTRGSTQDEPLVLTYNLIPSEVDDMVFDMDTVWKYPLEFYEAALEFKNPWDVKIERYKDRLDKKEQFEGLGFTHDTSDFNLGVRCSSYKTIPTMKEKVLGQMKIAEKLRAVDENDVARLIIDRHFMRDIKGNLRKFSQQQFRCVHCNEKYRRPPLRGVCLKCNGKIIFTISEGSIVKYLEPSLELVKNYNLPPYMKQALELTKQRIEMVFGKEKEKQEALGKWFG